MDRGWRSRGLGDDAASRLVAALYRTGASPSVLPPRQISQSAAAASQSPAMRLPLPSASQTPRAWPAEYALQVGSCQRQPRWPWWPRRIRDFDQRSGEAVSQFKGQLLTICVRNCVCVCACVCVCECVRYVVLDTRRERRSMNESTASHSLLALKHCILLHFSSADSCKSNLSAI